MIILGIPMFAAVIAMLGPGGAASDGFVVGAVGIIFLTFGSLVPGFGIVRPVTKYYAKETSPALGIASTAIAEGLREAGAVGAQPPQATGRVKCRSCGYLDSEDATFCSRCGQRL